MEYRIMFMPFLIAMTMTIKAEGRVFQQNSEISESTHNSSDSSSDEHNIDPETGRGANTSEDTYEASKQPSYGVDTDYTPEGETNTLYTTMDTPGEANQNGLGETNEGKYRLIFLIFISQMSKSQKINYYDFS